MGCVSMKRLRLYLDNCCFNRPFDSQSSVLIRMETDAKLHIQDLIREEKIELVWSFILDYENSANPFVEIRNWIADWQKLSSMTCVFSKEIATLAKDLMQIGLRQKDASHVACAIRSQADYFLTTDKKILNKKVKAVKVINPIDFIRIYYDAR